MASFTQRLRLCDPLKKKLPLIKEQLRKKVPTLWCGLTEQELKRFRRPFQAYSNELLEDGYPESSEHIRSLLSIHERNEKGDMIRDTTLIDNTTLLFYVIKCLKNWEDGERHESSTTDAINDLANFSVKMATISKPVCKELFKITLKKLAINSPDEQLKNKVRYLFGKFLVESKEYDVANIVLKEALEDSERNNFKELVLKICKVYHASLYNMSLQSMSTDTDLAIELANDSKEVALKMNDTNATILSLIQHGNILYSIENYAEAMIDFHSAIIELNKGFNLNLKLEVLYKLSTCCFITKNYDACLLSLGALGRLSTVYKSLVYQAHFYHLDGKMKLLMNKNILARRNFIKTIKIYDVIGLHQRAKSCRYLEAIAECEYLLRPWINILLESEKDRHLQPKYELNKARVLLFNWKLGREYFWDRMI